MRVCLFRAIYLILSPDVNKNRGWDSPSKNEFAQIKRIQQFEIASVWMVISGVKNIAFLLVIIIFGGMGGLISNNLVNPVPCCKQKQRLSPSKYEFAKIKRIQHNKSNLRLLLLEWPLSIYGSKKKRWKEHCNLEANGVNIRSTSFK